jgi:DNA repair exonuclease SbcCD ATPase subunit
MIIKQDKGRDHDGPSAGRSSAAAADRSISLDSDDLHGGNIDKIRAILFGNQMRDYDTRFSRLEDRLGKELSDLREDLRRRTESLESFIRLEVEALSSRLRNEYSERAESLKELGSSLDNLNKVFEKRTRQLDEELSKGQRELRQQILDQGKSLTDRLRGNHDEIMQLVERELAQLRSGKADRTALANLFTDLAIRLNNGLVNAAE